MKLVIILLCVNSCSTLSGYAMAAACHCMHNSAATMCRNCMLSCACTALLGTFRICSHASCFHDTMRYHLMCHFDKYDYAAAPQPLDMRMCRHACHQSILKMCAPYDTFLQTCVINAHRASVAHKAIATASALASSEYCDTSVWWIRLLYLNPTVSTSAKVCGALTKRTMNMMLPRMKSWM